MKRSNLDSPFLKKITEYKIHSLIRLPLVVVALLVSFSSGIVVGRYYFSFSDELKSPTVQGEHAEKEYPLAKYSFPALAERVPEASPLTVTGILYEEPEFVAVTFDYYSEGKKISGVMNFPKNVNTDQALPVILMVRGFVHEDEYEPGSGTQHAAQHYVKQGYITVAPDFLGFGTSDPQPGDALEARYVKPVNVIDLLASIEKFNLQPIIYQKKVLGRFDSTHLGMWGHSNGGQIALSVLEITRRPIPTILWAPVTKPFPYSVLYFTDESEDQGKSLRWMLANFEKDYNIDEFTIGQHLSEITANIILHQGTVDDAVPVSWSDDFYSLLAGKGKKQQIQYYKYAGDNHGLTVHRAEVLARDYEFLKENVKGE